MPTRIPCSPASRHSADFRLGVDAGDEGDMTTSCVGRLRNPRPSPRKSRATTLLIGQLTSVPIVPKEQRIQYGVDDETITESVLILATT